MQIPNYQSVGVSSKNRHQKAKQKDVEDMLNQKNEKKLGTLQCKGDKTKKNFITIRYSDPASVSTGAFFLLKRILKTDASDLVQIFCHHRS